MFDTLQEAVIFTQAAVDHMEPEADFNVTIEQVKESEVKS